jgi:hypothetical protein
MLMVKKPYSLPLKGSIFHAPLLAAFAHQLPPTEHQAGREPVAAGNKADRHAGLHRLGIHGQLQLGRETSSPSDAGDCLRLRPCVLKRYRPIGDGSLFLTLLTRALTGHIVKMGSPYDARIVMQSCSRHGPYLKICDSIGNRSCAARGILKRKTNKSAAVWWLSIKLDNLLPVDRHYPVGSLH